jgi:outer membrane protein OmpA-like peptidoglycan-associated protein/tetratricopeptide (TPR) repeat protein
MKKLYIALVLGIIAIPTFAQNSSTKKADKLFDRLQYVAAAKEYQKLVENNKADGYVYKQLADSYYYVFNPAEASAWYAKATETSQDAETYFRYAQMLKANGKYDDANKQMAKFASLAPNDSRAKDFKANPNYIPKLLSKKAGFTVETNPVSGENSDFGAVLYDDALYFSTARAGSKNYGWNNQPYLDIYRSILGDNGNFSEATPVSTLNTKFHDGTISITSDGNTAYYSTESFKDNVFLKIKSNNTKAGKIFLYKATRVGDTWANSTMLPFNSKEYSTGNPSVSRDGKTLYFASDRPGSLGGVDIWKVAINGDGSFGEPVNLGNKINTEANENFPFIADDNNTLYYSSAGKLGLGGYDVFQADLSKNTDPVNVGKPINSERDDISYTFNKSKNIGFFSSNRNGNDDIFTATPICGVEVQSIVSNAKTGALLSDAKVSILDDKNNVIATEMTNAAGEVKFNVECDKAYSIQASKDGFEGSTFAVAKSKGPEAKIDAKLQPIEVIINPTEIVLNPIYFEFDKHNITQQGAFELDKLVQVMKNNDKFVIFAKSHTDRRGDDVYNMQLSDRRAQSTVQYIISKGIAPERISGKGFGESELKVQCAKCTEDEHQQNRRSEFLIVKQ